MVHKTRIARPRQIFTPGSSWILTALAAIAFGSPPATSAPPGPANADPSVFTQHLDALIPVLLDRANVPGAAVAIVEDGEVHWVEGYGLADVASGRRVTGDTVFNVGSISKPVTAWAVMRLVEAGEVELDAPVTKYLKRWKPPKCAFDMDEVTIARLLSHTAGVSLGAVPEYGPDQEVPELAEALKDERHGVRIVEEPGTKWSYSGGGYMLLQLLIEDTTGEAFSAFVNRSVLEPLGMERSGFDVASVPVGKTATPYDEEAQPVAHFRYAGLAAAGLYSTANDLAKFVVAGLAPNDRDSPARRVLKAESIRLMRTPAPATKSSYLKYGLGYSLIPLPTGGFTAGHAGSNTGWMAVMSTIPKQRDGFVVLTNSSGGIGVYRWALCDWVKWKTGRSWVGFCDGRDEQPGGTLYAE